MRMCAAAPTNGRRTNPHCTRRPTVKRSTIYMHVVAENETAKHYTWDECGDGKYASATTATTSIDTRIGFSFGVREIVCRSCVRVGSLLMLLLYAGSLCNYARHTLGHNHSVGHHENYAIERWKTAYSNFLYTFSSPLNSWWARRQRSADYNGKAKQHMWLLWSMNFTRRIR